MLSVHDAGMISALHEEWIRRERIGEMRSVLELCTPGVVFLPPAASPIVGREAVGEWLAPPSTPIASIEADIELLQGYGSRAWKVARFRTVLRDEEGTDTVMRGTHLWVLERGRAGEWRVAVVTWSVQR